MGQTLAAGSAGKLCCVQERPQADEHTAYLSQFTGNSPQSPLNQSQHFINLEQHSNTKRGCLHLPLAHSEDQLIHPSLHAPFKTDLLSLVTPNGQGPDCCEICRAVCVSPAAGQTNPGYIDLATQGLDGEVRPLEVPQQLYVPPEFRHLDYDWSAHSSQQKEFTSTQLGLLESCMKPFVRAMLTGVVLQLRLDAEEAQGKAGGQNIDCLLSISQDLSTLLLSVHGVQRHVPMHTIRWVRPPADSGGQLSWLLPNERDQMVVLRLAGGRFLRLRFTSKEQAAFFGTCMRLLLKAEHPSTDRTLSSSPPSKSRSHATGSPW